MQTNNVLTIDLYGYWHTGSGRSAGALADALVQKTVDDLPVVGGRHLKGLLRHAVFKAEKVGWFRHLELPAGPAETIETLLFGSANQEVERFSTIPGMLIVNDGLLSKEEAAWLAKSEQTALRQQLYDRLSSTAMTEAGTAKADSLRTIEVVLPMTLSSQLSLQITAVDSLHAEQQAEWLTGDASWEVLTLACSLIDSIGASRSRGLGEALLTIGQGD